MSKKCTLTDQELIEICEQYVSELAKTGGDSFHMRVPPDMNKDTDMVLSELIQRFKTLTHANT